MFYGFIRTFMTAAGWVFFPTVLSIKLINPRRIPDQTPVIVCERVARLKKKERKRERNSKKNNKNGSLEGTERKLSSVWVAGFFFFFENSLRSVTSFAFKCEHQC